MTLHHADKMYDNPIEVAKPYLSYIAMFVGMGLISGSIVHAAQEGIFNRSIFLMGIGVILFSMGSFVNEVIFKTGNIEREGVLRYILFSLFLAMGVGMISGSTQHFFDTPIYASYLMPIGVFLSSLAFALRNNYELSKATWGKLIVAGLVFAGVLFYGLNTYAKSLAVNTAGHHGAQANDSANAHEQTPSAQAPAAANGEHQMAAVTNDESFLSGMIPHHQEAVDTSALILARTNNPQLTQFTQQVIATQSQEIAQMKQWYATTQGKPYQASGSYMPMMASTKDLQAATPEADALYMQGMIAHHEGAIAMAQQILPITQNPNIKKMAQTIVDTQSKEVELLKNWLTQSGVKVMPSGHDNSKEHHNKP